LHQKTIHQKRAQNPDRFHFRMHLAELDRTELKIAVKMTIFYQRMLFYSFLTIGINTHFQCEQSVKSSRTIIEKRLFSLAAFDM